ncbi:MAG: heme ABC exporter ATP-binding protein CcmA [Fidelibacterota bacterium]
MDNKETSSFLEIRDLTKSFGRITALKNVNISVSKGDFLTIFGPNGAGKTTLMKIIASLMRPSSGRIYIDGMEYRSNSSHLRRKIGLISHSTFLYGELNAYENLKFYGRMYGVDNLHNRINQLIREFGLRERLFDPVRTYSRGMQQRLAIARGIIHNPTLILMDEPYTGLDPGAADRLSNILRRLHSNENAVIMTTHIIERGFIHASRVTIINRGGIVFQADKNEISLEDFQKQYKMKVNSDAFNRMKVGI